MSPHTDRVLICGLGSLGQQCVLALRTFGHGEGDVRITAVDLALPDPWEVPEVPSLLSAPPVVGDCRMEEVLERAGVRECRAVLLLAVDEAVNVAAAFTVRRLNPGARIVLRSSREHLNERLEARIPNLEALEPAGLSAAAFALAGRDDGTLGVFRVGTHRLRVAERLVGPGDPLAGADASGLFCPGFRLLSLRRGDESPPARAFFDWTPGDEVRSGDTVAWVDDVVDEVPRRRRDPSHETHAAGARRRVRPPPVGALGALVSWVRAESRRTVVAVGLATALALWGAGSLLLHATVPGMTWRKAVTSGAVLLLGGFGDVFGGLEQDPVPWWTLAISLGITLTSILFILGVFGLIADSILSARFDLLARRARMPRGDHVVVVGLGRVGRRVASFLVRELGEKVVALVNDPALVDAAPGVPVLVGEVLPLLSRASLGTARRLVAVTDDPMLNLEIALVGAEEAAAAGHEIGLTVRVFDNVLGESLSRLLPGVRALNAYALSADAFAGAAFGENVLSLFRLAGRTILVTEFQVAADDTLSGRLLSEVAYGYGVAPVLHRRPPSRGDGVETLFPPDTVRLAPGDTLVVLASLNGLRRVEQGVDS